MSNALNLMVKFTGVDKLSGSLRNMLGAAGDGSRSIRALRDEAKELRKQLREVGSDIAASTGNITTLVNKENRLEAALAAVNAQLDKQKQRLERVAAIQSRAGNVASAAGNIGSRASLFATAPLVAFGAAAVSAAVDAEELGSAFNVTFGKAAADMEQWAARTGGALNRTQTELMGAANTFGIFFNQADPRKSAELSRQFTVLAQDLSSFYNVDPGTALEKLRSGLTGESEPLRDFGVFMTEAAVKTQALKMGLKPLNGELSEQQKIMARAGLIMAQTKAAQGDLERTSGSTANQIRAANTAWTNMSLVVGRELVPALTPVIHTLTDLIKGFSSLSPGMCSFIVIGGVAAAAVGPLLLGISGIASAVAGLAPLLAGGLPAIAGALAAIGWPVVALAGAAFLLYRYWGPIKGFFVGLWTSISGAVTRNWTSIRNVLLGGMVIFAPIVAAVVWVATTIYRNWDGIRAATMNMVARVGAIVGPFLRPFQIILGFLGALRDRFFGFGANMVGGLVRGIVSMTGSVIRAIVGLAGQIGAKFAALLGIKSPSRLFMAFGGHIATGLGMGLDRGRDGAMRAMGRLAAGVVGAGSLGLAAPALAQAPITPAGRPAPPASAAASPRGESPVTIHIHQQPGEDATALADRVVRLIDDRRRAARLSAFRDDF